MRKLLGIGAFLLGGLGVLLCVTAVGIGWWAAVRTAARRSRARITTSTGPGTMGFKRVLYPPGPYSGPASCTNRYFSGCHRNACMDSRTLPLVYFVYPTGVII